MKRFKMLFVPAMMFLLITIFWLIPSINKATTHKYTRVFEDTDVAKRKRSLPANNNNSTPIVQAEIKPEKQKIFKKETIEDDISLKDIEPEMFSRAIHFHEDILADEIILPEEDSMMISVVMDSDTVYLKPDSLALLRP